MKTLRLILHTGLVTAAVIVLSLHSSFAQNSFPTPTGPVLIDATGVGAGNGGELRLGELDVNGVNYVGLRAPDVVTGNQIYIFPNGFPSGSGRVLASDATGNLSWVKRARTDLSNLEVVTNINANLLPMATNTLDLGSNVLRWRDVHLFNLKFSNGTIQTTAFLPYTNGTGIVISGVGGTISLANTAVVPGVYGSTTLIPQITIDAQGRITTATTVAPAFANRTLSNLLTLSIDQSLLPDGDNTRDIGSAALSWQDLFIDGDIFVDGNRFISHEGSENTFLGNSAGIVNTGNQNTFVGDQAGTSNTSGSNNTFMGENAGFVNTTGGNNIMIGTASGDANTTGSNNTFLGFNAGSANSTASGSTFIGSSAGDVSTGVNNTFVGFNAGGSNTIGTENTFVGFQAGLANTDGVDNTAVGDGAMNALTTGDANVSIGEDAGNTLTTGSECTLLGEDADVSSGALTFATAVGSGAIVNASDKMQLGSQTATILTSNGYTVVSDARFKDNLQESDLPGLDFINGLHPVTYQFNFKRYDDFLRKDMNDKETSDAYQSKLIEKGTHREVGFLAQDVEKLISDQNVTFNGLYTPQNENDNYALDYGRFVVPLVKAVQELSASNDVKDEEISKLESRVEKLEAQLQSVNFTPTPGSTDGVAKLSLNATDVQPVLGQNIPNPFDGTTLIPFRLPKNCKDASLRITETTTGSILRVIPLVCGETQISIDAGLLASGTYTYTLYVDGNLVDTKQMVLTK